MPVGAAIGGAAIIGGGISAYGATKAAGIQANAAREGQATERDVAGQQLAAQREVAQQQLLAQQHAARDAQQLQLGMYNQSRSDLAPYREGGAGAYTSLLQLYGIGPDGTRSSAPFPQASLDAFRNSPDYQFASDEGRRQVNFGSAAKGELGIGAGGMTGNRGRDLTSFGQGLATQQFGNYFNRLLQLSQIGQGAAGATVSAGTSVGNTVGGQQIQAAQGTGGQQIGAVQGTGQQQLGAAGNIAQLQLGQGSAQASGVVGATNAVTSSLGQGTNNLMLWNALGNRSAYGSPGGGTEPGGSLSNWSPTGGSMAG